MNVYKAKPIYIAVCMAQRPDNSTYNPTPLTCSGPDGRCVLQEWICDGIRDCPNGDDEAAELCSDGKGLN